MRQHVSARHIIGLTGVRKWHVLVKLSVGVCLMVFKICVLVTVMSISGCGILHMLGLHLAFQKAVFLFGAHVVVLVSLLCLLTFHSGVLWHRLCADRLKCGRLVRVNIMQMLGMVGLHFEDEVSFFDVGLGGAESGAVGVESSIVTFVPPV